MGDAEEKGAALQVALEEAVAAGFSREDIKKIVAEAVKPIAPRVTVRVESFGYSRDVSVSSSDEVVISASIPREQMGKRVRLCVRRRGEDTVVLSFRLMEVG